MLTRNQNYMDKSKPIKFIVTRKPVGRIAMKSVGFILAKFLQTIQL